MFCRKFGWPSMKVLQIKVYTDLTCSDVHWNFWRMCNPLQPGSEVCNWYRLAISPIWRRRSTKKSTVFILHFTPACVLLSVCSLHFTLSLHFTPGPQSAVCSPQSVFYTDRIFKPILSWKKSLVDLNLCTLSQLTLCSVQCSVSHFNMTNAKSILEEMFLDSQQFIGNIFVLELFFFIYTMTCESKWFGFFCGGIKSANYNVKWMLYIQSVHPKNEGYQANWCV